MVTFADHAVAVDAYIKERLRADQLCFFFRVCIYDIVRSQPLCAATVAS